jgi:CRP-like cAMP-binding protein
MDRVEMFKGLNDDQLKAIQDIAESVEFEKGDIIFKHGEPAENLWIVVEGEIQFLCEISQDVQKDVCEPLSFISSAQCYGWHCFVPPYQYRLTGYCASRSCKLIRLKKQDLEAMFADDPKMGFAMMQYTLNAIGTQFQELQDEIARRIGQEIMTQW